MVNKHVYFQFTVYTKKRSLVSIKCKGKQHLPGSPENKFISSVHCLCSLSSTLNGVDFEQSLCKG